MRHMESTKYSDLWYRSSTAAEADVLLMYLLQEPQFLQLQGLDGRAVYWTTGKLQQDWLSCHHVTGVFD
jgi:hypothetical protein